MIDVFAIVWALCGVLMVTVIVGVPIWLVWRIAGAVRARLAVPWARRIGDRERAAVARRLGDDYAQGRLPLWELEARLDDAGSAATYADLRAIAHDLPPARRPRAFTAVDLGLAFLAGLVLIGFTPFLSLLLVGGILVRRRLLA